MTYTRRHYCRIGGEAREKVRRCLAGHRRPAATNKGMPGPWWWWRPLALQLLSACLTNIHVHIADEMPPARANNLSSKTISSSDADLGISIIVLYILWFGEGLATLRLLINLPALSLSCSPPWGATLRSSRWSCTATARCRHMQRGTFHGSPFFLVSFTISTSWQGRGEQRRHHSPEPHTFITISFLERIYILLLLLVVN
jgi:hypothetical protein